MQGLEGGGGGTPMAAGGLLALGGGGCWPWAGGAAGCCGGGGRARGGGEACRRRGCGITATGNGINHTHTRKYTRDGYMSVTRYRISDRDRYTVHIPPLTVQYCASPCPHTSDLNPAGGSLLTWDALRAAVGHHQA